MRTDEDILLESLIGNWAGKILKRNKTEIRKIKFQYFEKGQDAWIIANKGKELQAMSFSNGSRQPEARIFANKKEMDTFIADIRTIGFKRVEKIENIKKSLQPKIGAIARGMSTTATVGAVGLVIAAIMGVAFPSYLQFAAGAIGAITRLIGDLGSNGEWMIFEPSTEYNDVTKGIEDIVNRINVPGATEASMTF